MLTPLASVACTPDRYAGIDLRPGGASVVVQELARRAQAGDKQAQLELGRRYEGGDVVAQDFDRAIGLYALAGRSRPSTLYVYSPAVGHAPAQVRAINTGIAQVGSSEAVQRLHALKRRLGR